MKKPSAITTVESRVDVPVNMLEDHVNSKHHPHDSNPNTTKKIFSQDFENIRWCTEELLVEGMVEIHINNGLKQQCLSIPVITGLLIVCTRGRENTYKVNWSSSLS